MRTLGEALTAVCGGPAGTRDAAAPTRRDPPATLSSSWSTKAPRSLPLTWRCAGRWPQSACSAPTWARRLSQVRRFATWLERARPADADPTGTDPGRPTAPEGGRHIFTDQEITDLITAAGRLTSSNGLRAHTYTTLIGLLTTTGLRPGEALRLERADVDLERGMLFIRDSKFGKSRFVPLHESTRAALARYVRRRPVHQAHAQTDAFLVSDSGRPLSGSAARRTFAHLTPHSGTAPTTGRRIGRRPRLQDVSPYLYDANARGVVSRRPGRGRGSCRRCPRP